MKKAAFIFLFVLSQHVFSQNADLRILTAINSGQMPFWDKTMRGVSFSIYGVMPTTAVSIWSHGYFTKDKAMMRNGYKSAASIGLALALSTGLKYLVNRKRPFVQYPKDIVQKAEVGPFSFPSGHTTSAFATATALSLSYKKWYVTAPSFLYAGFVGYSRMRLGVHYPTDVLGGILIGIGSGLLTWKLDQVVNRK